MTKETEQIERRKADHLRLAAGDVESGRGTGFDDLHLVHNAVPEADFDQIDTSVPLLGRTLRMPLVISAMTGGHEQGGAVNAILARAAERFGIAMGVGSQRAALHTHRLEASYAVTRREAPNALLLANIGLAQLIAQREAAALSVDDVQRLVSMIEADALVVHLNVLQELVQPEGERMAVGALSAIGQLVRELDVPVIAKETGAGMSPDVAERLAAVGVAALDVGGVGGTSFAAVEALRAEQRGDRQAAHLGSLLRDWGIPTAAAIALAATRTELPIIGTGGIRSGLDAAKAIALGASAVGVARPLLQRALEGSDEAVREWIETFALELRAVMFLTGSTDIHALRRASRVITGDTAGWIAQLA